jgi:hypothetical protein
MIQAMVENPPLRQQAPVAALTVLEDPKKVFGPEDLSPKMAREIATLVASHRPTAKEMLAHEVPPLVAILAALGGAALFLGPGVISWPALAGGLIGGSVGLLNAWRAAPIRAASRALKKMGVPLRGRRRILKKIQNIVGTFPPRDPADRPSAEEIAQHLEPALQDDGLQAPLARPARIANAEELEERPARTLVDQWLTWRFRGRVVAWIYGGIPLSLVVLLLAKGLPFKVLISVMAIQLPILLGSLGLFHLIIQGKLRKHLRELGLEKKEQKRILQLLRRLVRGKALRKLKRPDKVRALSQALLTELQAPKNPALELVELGSGLDS